MSLEKNFFANCLRVHCIPMTPDVQEYTPVANPDGLLQLLRLCSPESQLKSTNMGGFCAVVVVEKVYFSEITNLSRMRQVQNSGRNILLVICNFNDPLIIC